GRASAVTSSGPPPEAARCTLPRTSRSRSRVMSALINYTARLAECSGGIVMPSRGQRRPRSDLSGRKAEAARRLRARNRRQSDLEHQCERQPEKLAHLGPVGDLAWLSRSRNEIPRSFRVAPHD